MSRCVEKPSRKSVLRGIVKSVEFLLRELRQVANRAGWEVGHVYKDHGISGAKGKDKRPAFDALHKAAARREFDVVMAWSVDRLGRSLQDLVGFLSEIHAAGVDLFLHQGIDTTTPGGKAMFQMLACSPSSSVRSYRNGCAPDCAGPSVKAKSLAADVEAGILAALKARKDTGDSVRKIAGTVRHRSEHGAAYQPPFRRKRGRMTTSRKRQQRA